MTDISIDGKLGLKRVLDATSRAHEIFSCMIAPYSTRYFTIGPLAQAERDYRPRYGFSDEEIEKVSEGIAGDWKGRMIVELDGMDFPMGLHIPNVNRNFSAIMEFARADLLQEGPQLKQLGKMPSYQSILGTWYVNHEAKNILHGLWMEIHNGNGIDAMLDNPGEPHDQPKLTAFEDFVMENYK